MRFLFSVLALLMFFAWIGALVVLHLATFFIRFSIIVALVFLVIHFVSGRRTT